MYCLLCHEKIPRLRAWRTKSEFCCDEHASLYKKQTLERLLVDPSASQNGQSHLPEPPEPEEFEMDEPAVPTQETAAASADDVQVEAGASPNWRGLDFPGQFENDDDLPEPAEMDETDGIGEVWRIADEAHHRAAASSHAGSPAVNSQSAEEALEALRSLANRSSKVRDAQDEEPRPRPVFEMPAPAPGEPGLEPEFDERALLDEIREAGEDLPVLKEELAPEPEAEQTGEPEEPRLPQPSRAAHPEEISILDELMADPLDSWPRDARAGRASAPIETWTVHSDEPEVDESFAEERIVDESLTEELGAVDLAAEEPIFDELLAESPVSPTAGSSDDSADGGAAAAALRELVNALEAVDDSVNVLDLDAPEPDWAFDDDSSAEISALKESLSAVGSPAARFDIGDSSDIDVSPDEPDFEELAAFDLDQDDIEPPEPEVANERQTAAPAASSRNGTNHGEPTAHGAPRQATRFKPVTEFAEIRLEPASWQPHGDWMAAASANRLDAVAPQLSTVSLPPEMGWGPGRSGTMSMHEASVRIEPEASLETEVDSDLGARLGPAPMPFAPGGLFFDLSGCETMQPEPESVASGGGKSRS
ncbi:MAG: hypothetical protein KDC27_08660 [Acidobacteria bacterium]|nr:hypothetical protein [Acidobacteriota bacterium]